VLQSSNSPLGVAPVQNDIQPRRQLLTLCANVVHYRYHERTFWVNFKRK
jgi:hypothetical protein